MSILDSLRPLAPNPEPVQNALVAMATEPALVVGQVPLPREQSDAHFSRSGKTIADMTPTERRDLVESHALTLAATGMKFPDEPDAAIIQIALGVANRFHDLAALVGPIARAGAKRDLENIAGLLSQYDTQQINEFFGGMSQRGLAALGFDHDLMEDAIMATAMRDFQNAVERDEEIALNDFYFGGVAPNPIIDRSIGRPDFPNVGADPLTSFELAYDPVRSAIYGGSTPYNGGPMNRGFPSVLDWFDALTGGGRYATNPNSEFNSGRDSNPVQVNDATAPRGGAQATPDGQVTGVGVEDLGGEGNNESFADSSGYSPDGEEGFW